MSHFVASAIRFSPDFLTFEVFGDDNNVFPKFNKWTKDIPTADLLRELSGGLIVLSWSKYPAIYQAVNEAIKSFEARFGECEYPNNQKSIWHWPDMLRENSVTEDDKIFFAELEQKFLTAIQGAPRKKTIVAPNDKRSVATAALSLF